MNLIGFGAMCVTKPYNFIGFGAMDVTKPYEFIGFGAMYVTKPYKSIGFEAMDVTKPYKFIGFGAMAVTGGPGPAQTTPTTHISANRARPHPAPGRALGRPPCQRRVTKLYELYRVWGHVCHQTV